MLRIFWNGFGKSKPSRNPARFVGPKGPVTMRWIGPVFVLRTKGGSRV